MSAIATVDLSRWYAGGAEARALAAEQIAQHVLRGHAGKARLHRRRVLGGERRDQVE